MDESFQVWMCPPLREDGWVSIEKYHADLMRGFELHGKGERMKSFVPPSSSHGRMAVNWNRYVKYPSVLKKNYQETRNQPLLHVLDHSYGHLLPAAARRVVTVLDLAGMAAQKPLWGITGWLYRWRVMQCKKADGLIAISEHTARDIATYLGVPRERIHVISNAVSDMFCRSDQGSVTAAGLRVAELGRSSAILLHVGSNDDRKNVKTVLRVLAQFREQGRGVTLVKVGQEVLKGELGRMAAELGVADLVVDLGSVDDAGLVEVYRQADVFCFPSSYEGFGRPVVEAQMCGTPVVCAENSSLPEVAGEGALMHEAEDWEAAARLIASILDNSAERDRLVTEGFKNADRFSVSKQAGETWKVYEFVNALTRKP